ncbi:MAG: hypothetical protein COZ75_02885 [Flavobacteriaceae bacterium CG_4_8_14_3_um_filter_34_10]|nr:MAG: hypothetical protein COW66_08540 [Flavobacteriaceae bacterium CG18_big_fil_WC_8_21_14_2_50_34_36]PIV50123.1 MAG: hypothetical protein COS19_05130 [Flavobacteriaceae bacterium CG02_land_8_20_14_3_00_34_13]PIX10187.1 MAG: hypothetical protein COZ75_02885 [Flavobacteriaceae bacterium CG_4_8_14_3_um_filter_34_10]
MEYSEKLKMLAQNLRKSEKVNSFDSLEERESETLAHSILDIEESCKTLLNNLFPKLEPTTLSQDEINELLFDIGEELRHILYHINDPKFYDYLKE